MLRVVVLSLGGCLLELDVVDLVDEGLLHFRRDGHVDVHNISILLSELLVHFNGLVVVHGLAGALGFRVLLPLAHCLRQLRLDLLLQLLVRHDWQVVECAGGDAHLLQLLPGVGVDREGQLGRLLEGRWLHLHRVRGLLFRCFDRLRLA